MPIHTQDYRHWEGTLKQRNYTRWWVIAKAELKLLAQRKIVRLIVAIPPVIYILSYGILIYIYNIFPMPMEFDIDRGFFQGFLFRINTVQSAFFIALVVIFGGAGLIANDLKHNTLSLYLSKPISWVDYLIGKFIVIGTLLTCMTLVPGLLLFLEHVLLTDTPFLKENYWLPLSIIVYSVIIITITSLLMLLFSSLTTNSRYATIGFCAVWFGLPVLHLILKEVLSTSTVALVSVWANFDRLGNALFGLESSYNMHWSLTVLLLAALTAACILVLRHRIRAIEIVK
jgi:ABC-type transport system involved in multi-copper enzyme maturation permease subunit